VDALLICDQAAVAAQRRSGADESLVGGANQGIAPQIAPDVGAILEIAPQLRHAFIESRQISAHA